MLKFYYGTRKPMRIYAVGRVTVHQGSEPAEGHYAKLLREFRERIGKQN